MKSSKFIKLLAALLCVIMAFVSCSGDTANADGANPDAIKPLSELVPLLEDANAGTTVYKSLSDLAEIKYKSPVYFKEALKLEGELLIENSDKVGAAFVMRTSEIGADNLAKEIYNVYSIRNGDCVLTVENVYDYTKDTKDSELNVYVVSEGEAFFSCAVIIVERITRTLLTAEEMEGNFRFDKAELNYKEETSYEYYDMTGKLFDTSNSLDEIDIEFASTSIYSTIFSVYIGESCHYFNINSEYVRTENESDAGIGAYDWERGNYGYKYSSEYGLMQIFDMLAGKIVAQYNIGEVDSLAVLEDGTIFVQNNILVEDDGADYDYASNYYDEDRNETVFGKYNLETYIINAETGEKTELDFDYIVESINAISDFRELEDILAMFVPYEAVYKDTVVNFATGVKIVDKQLSGMVQVYIDNSANVNYENEAEVLDNKPLLGERYELLSNGAFLYTTNEGYQIIVGKDGKEIILPLTAQVKDPVIITEDKVYDLDFNVVISNRDNYGYDYGYNYDKYTDNAEYEKEVIEYVCSVGDFTIFSSFERYVEDYDDDDEPIYAFETRYYRVYKSSNSNYVVDTLSSIEDVVDSSKDYLIAENENGKYVLYNSKYEHVYTSENTISVFAFGEQYWFSTYSEYEGKYIVCKLN